MTKDDESDVRWDKSISCRAVQCEVSSLCVVMILRHLSDHNISYLIFLVVLPFWLGFSSDHPCWFHRHNLRLWRCREDD